ncbi:MAG TPA: hypothetical protein VIM89_15640 [Mucilaginibacter sp.]
MPQTETFIIENQQSKAKTLTIFNLFKLFHQKKINKFVVYNKKEAKEDL